VVERPFQVYFAVEALLVIVDIKWAVELIFRTFEPVLHLSRWVELGGRREAASFISAVSADTHLLPKAEGSLWIKS